MAEIYNPPSVNALQKTLDAQLLSGATASMTLNNVTSVVDGVGVVVIDRVDANGVSTASKREYVKFTGVSGSTLTGLTRNVDSGGSDQDHAVGAIVEFIFDVVQGKEIKDIFETEHSTAGAHTTTFPNNLTIADAKDFAWASGAKMERSDGHLVLEAETSKLVKIKILTQNNVTDAYKSNVVILTGWGWILGDGAAHKLSETVTFGIEFTEYPVVVISVAGGKANSNPANLSELTVETMSTTNYGAHDIAKASFSADLGRVSDDGTDPGVLTATVRYGYAWIAIAKFS